LGVYIPIDTCCYILLWSYRLNDQIYGIVKAECKRINDIIGYNPYMMSTTVATFNLPLFTSAFFTKSPKCAKNEITDRLRHDGHIHFDSCDRVDVTAFYGFLLYGSVWQKIASNLGVVDVCELYTTYNLIDMYNSVVNIILLTIGT